MKLSKKGEYACLALIYLSSCYTSNGNPVTTSDIALSQNIPKKYLEQILLQLKGNGYVKSIRGINGGYKLAKAPSAISVAEIVRLIDGPIAPVESASVFFYEASPSEKSDKLIALFKDIRNIVAERLENTKFSDLI